MKPLVLLLSFVLSASSAQAQDDLADARSAFVVMIEKNGCAMTEDEAAIEMPTAGIDRDTSLAITEALLKEGLAVLEGQTLTLKTEKCL